MEGDLPFRLPPGYAELNACLRGRMPQPANDGKGRKPPTHGDETDQDELPERRTGTDG